MSFAKLKKSKSNNESLRQSVQDSGSGAKDPRMWKHKYDKDSFVGSSTIRFLPRYVEGEIAVPWVAWTEYSFKTKAGNYWNRALTNLGEDDPVSLLNNAHWEKITDKKGPEAADARKRNVKKKYIANIVVMNDPTDPSNNGKVFLYEFGPSIQKILEKVWFPEYSDKVPLEFFDWDTGANLTIRSKKDSYDWLTYEDTEFGPSEALAEGRVEVQEALYNNMHDMAEFEPVHGDKYKSFDELSTEMTKALGARYIAKIMGTEYSPAQDAAAGGNAFAGSGQQSEGTTDPFAKVEQKADESETKVDPFAKVEQKADESDAKVDPFAGANTEGQIDPFANLKVNG